MDKPNKVVQALKVLQEEGREDLLREGTTKEVTGPDLGVQDFYPLHEGVLCTSHGAGVAEQGVIEDKLLDYEEEEEGEKLHSGQRRAVQKGTTPVVAREVDKKAVQSDRQVGRVRQVFFAGNFLRGLSVVLVVCLVTCR
ncbi:hypothetical protein NDU88_003706 [Pleurodeles waltl]|uniref:Uncharacterized protein n=1 Tax=Pleurodeles waltl TaxID=8319 RepID=A0AAV7M9K0_PLEWA|nr:hypothetical protein NDU88_003706 [Pleurodeles waltl]